MEKLIELKELYRQRDKKQSHFMESKQKRVEELENELFPTDELISEIAETSYPSVGGYNDTSYHERRGFEEGAEWVIKMIKNYKKWN